MTKKTQSTPPSPAPSLPGFESAWDTLGNSASYLVYGQSGTGKTTLWATFPGPILTLICSGSKNSGELRSVDTPEYRRKITPVYLESSEMLREILTGSKLDHYKTIVLDHLSGFSDLILKELLGLSELPAQKSWGLASRENYGTMVLKVKEFVRTLLSLNKSVVLVAQERNFGEGEELSGSNLPVKAVVGAGVTPSLASWINPACDYIIQTFKRTKMVTKTVKVGNKEVVTTVPGTGVDFCLRTGPHESYHTKFRVPKGTVLPDVIVNPTYEAIQNLITGNLGE